jgi:hypothetical protein
MRRGVRAKIHFFIFFYLFLYKYLQIYTIRKIRVFRPNAQVRPTKGDVFFQNAMKKANHKFEALICLPSTLKPFVPFCGQLIPCYQCNQRLNFLCASVSLWLKLNQSKITNYAKQTQFPKTQK